MPLIRKLGEDAARELFESLTKLLYEHKDETTRDLAGSGMKIMLESISPENAKVVIKVMNPKLINGAKDAAKADAVKDKAQMSLELLGELLSRFGKVCFHHFTCLRFLSFQRGNFSCFCVLM